MLQKVLVLFSTLVSITVLVCVKVTPGTLDVLVLLTSTVCVGSKIVDFRVLFTVLYT